MKKNTLILAGGRIEPNFALTVYHQEKFKKVIAVDGGLQAADQIGIIPTDIVGDFDTVDADLLRSYENRKGIQIRRFCPEKDMTDSQIAMEMAVEWNSSSIVLLGATGSRIDHMMGNLSLLLMPLKAGIPACIWDSTNRIRLIKNTTTIKRNDQFGTYLSLLPYTDEVRGINLYGFRYPLNEYTMSKIDSYTIGISNERIEEEAQIQLKKGILVVIESKDEG